MDRKRLAKGSIYSTILCLILAIPLLMMVIARGRYALTYSALNWDLLAYVGLVEQLHHYNNIEIHYNAYHDVYSYAKLHAAILMDIWNQLIAGPLLQSNYKSADIFDANLPFYACKPLYVWVLYLVSFFTSTITAAAVYISVACGFIAAGLVGLFSYLKKSPFLPA